jgi:hypothetical protein
MCFQFAPGDAAFIAAGLSSCKKGLSPGGLFHMTATSENGGDFTAKASPVVDVA